ncbi:MAG: ATP-binding protein [Lachnospiraceae bacterium]
MKKQTIKAKMTVWFSALFFVLIMLVFGAFIMIGRNTVKTDTKEKLRTLVQANAEELEYLNVGEERDDDEGDHFVAYRDHYLEIDDDFCDYMDGVSVSLYYQDRFLYGENPIHAFPDEIPFQNEQLQTVKYEQENYYVYDLLVEGEGLEELWLRGVVSKKQNVPALYHAIWLMLLALPLLALIAITGGYHIVRRSLQPLDDICEQANHINEGADLTQRIQIAHKSKETDILADTFNGMLDRLYTSFQAEKQFTSDASHELRTPIAVILAECEYALEETDATEWKKALEVIERQGQRMSSLVENLLLFTRMEQGTLSLGDELVGLTELVEEIVHEQELLHQDGNIMVSLQLQPDRVIRGDRNLLSRMITNLISNAYKYGKENGTIQVRLYTNQEDRLVLEVQDDGIGIKEEDLPFIWNRFYRAEYARHDHTSVGVGLAMVRQIAQLHHAETEVISEFGKGSTFLILF